MNSDSIFTNPLKDAVFVFGSNLTGRHTKGAAEYAVKHYGARPGCGEGFTGLSYAIPTKDMSMRTLPLSDVYMYVKNFLAFAREHRELFFMVTRIGCGLAGYSDEQVAPMFNKVPANVWIPGKWLMRLNHLDRARLIVAGTPGVLTDTEIEHQLTEDTKFWNRKFEIITNNSDRVGQIASAWGRRHDIPWTPFPADVDKFGDIAEKVNNLQMSWYATHLIAYWDGVDPIVENLINTAKSEGLRVKINEIISHKKQLELVG